MNQVVKFALLFLIMVGSVAARRPVVHDLFLAEDTSKEADAINKMNDYLQGIGADMEKRYSVGSVLQKHKLQDDYINLLEEGGRATALALAATAAACSWRRDLTASHAVAQSRPTRRHSSAVCARRATASAQRPT